MELTIETEELFVVSGSLPGPDMWCGRCAQPVRSLSLQAAARLTSVEADRLMEWLCAGELHALESSGSAVLICLRSLMRKRSQSTGWFLTRGAR